jgi:uncharacterized membrane protein
MNITPWLLYLHVLGAIVAFGPTFVFPFYGAAGGREPQHANFVTRASYRVATRLVAPLAILQGVTGLGLVIVNQWDLLATTWLLVGIALYLVALFIALGLNLPNTRRIIELSSVPPAPGSGPSPELLTRIASARRNGTILVVLIVIIVGLMVVKPTF